MTFVIRLHDAPLTEQLTALSLKEKEKTTTTPVQDLATRISAVVMLSEGEYTLQLATIPEAMHPHVHELRRAAVPLLQELERSDTELMAKTMAENVKMEELTRSVCKESTRLRDIVEGIERSKRADILTHAQKLIPHCLTESAIENILDVITLIVPEQRTEALEQLPSVLSKSIFPESQSKLTFRLSCLMKYGAQNGLVLKEYLAILIAIAPKHWENNSPDTNDPIKWLFVFKKALPLFTDAMLSNTFFIDKMILLFSTDYSDSVLRHVFLLKEYSARIEDLEKIMTSINSIPEEDRGQAVQNCISVLTPLDEKTGRVCAAFGVLQSCVAKEYLELVPLMQPGTPARFLNTIKELLQKAPVDRRIEVKDEVAKLFRSNMHSDDLDKALSSLSLNIGMNKDLSNIALEEETYLLNSLCKGVETNELKDMAQNIRFTNRLAILRTLHYLMPNPGMYEQKRLLLETLAALDLKGTNTQKLVFNNVAVLETASIDKYPKILTELASSK